MIEQTASINSGDLLKMTDLEDLNGAFYDIDAQDLLDVWEAMDSGNCESNGSFGASNNISWNGMFRSTVQATPVLKDKLLTDSMIRVNGEFPPTVSNEHSYSLGRTSSDSLTGNGAASDGDSIPESPLSLHDDMETECYPCIPMQTASNQKRRSSSFFESTTIKEEPFSPRDVDINVVDDDDDDTISDDKLTTFFSANGTKVRNRTSACIAKKQNTVVASTTATTTTVNNNHNSSNNNIKSEAPKLPQLRQTVRLTRPKHPQSLLKHQPVLLMTTTLASSALQQQQQQQITNNSSLQGNNSVLTTAKLSTAAKEQQLQQQQQQQQQNTELVYRSGCDWSSPAPSPASSCSSSSAGKSVLNRTPIHTALISSQPNDGFGELVLTEEEKKTLISEGYPIPTKLPLSKAEERSLKKIRRKIKNKISAQESRRKKKEFVDTLEKKVEEASAELGLYKKKCEHLAKENSALIDQVKSLRAMLEQATNKSSQHQQTFKMEPEDDFDEVLTSEIDLD